MAKKKQSETETIRDECDAGDLLGARSRPRRERERAQSVLHAVQRASTAAEIRSPTARCRKPPAHGAATTALRHSRSWRFITCSCT